MLLNESKYVFICYKHDDLGTSAAGRVERFLRPKGIRTWRDTEIPAGADWDEELSEAIEAAGALILLWSASASKSNEVKAEWNRILKRKRKVYIIRLDETELPHRLDYLQPLGELNDETLNKLLVTLKGEVNIESWISETPFTEEVEEEFVNCLSAEDVTWFYNPYPANRKSRFVIQGFPNLPNEYYPATAISEVTSEIEDVVNELSQESKLLVAVKRHEVRHETYFVSELLDNFDVFLVEDESWETIIQCQACSQLQVGELFEPHVKDDLLSYEIGIFETWCPLCEARCEECGNRTSSYVTSRGLCEECQDRFSHNINKGD